MFLFDKSFNYFIHALNLTLLSFSHIEITSYYIVNLYSDKQFAHTNLLN